MAECRSINYIHVSFHKSYTSGIMSLLYMAQ